MLVTQRFCLSVTILCGVILAQPAVRGQCSATNLSAWDNAAQKGFGVAAAVGNDFAAFGATGDDSRGSFAGAVYVFRRAGQSWIQDVKLNASDGQTDDVLGGALDADVDALIAGAVGDDDAAADAGAAYIFRRTGDAWQQEAKLTAWDAADGDSFGAAVALHGDVALVSAVNSDGGAQNAGSAYVFHRVESVWTPVVKLSADDPSAFARFGYRVAVSGGTLAVSADIVAKVYLFDRDENGWIGPTVLTAKNDPKGLSGFGSGLDLDGDTLAASALHENTHRGSVYVFKRSAGAWAFDVKLISPDANDLDHFGWTVGLAGDHIIVGADYRRRAYLFTRLGGSWTPEATLTSHTPSVDDGFASVAAIGAAFAAVAAPADESALPGAGSGYVYDLPDCVTQIPTVGFGGMLALVFLLATTGACLVSRARSAYKLGASEISSRN